MTSVDVDRYIQEYDKIAWRKNPADSRLIRELREGTLPLRAFAGWNAQMYWLGVGATIVALPLYYALCPDTEIKRMILANLMAEGFGYPEGNPPHYEASVELCRRCGMTDHEIFEVEPIPEMKAHNDHINSVGLLHGGRWLDGVLAFGSIENCFGPLCEVMRDSMIKHYDFSAEDPTLKYFTMHVSGAGSDEEHVETIRTILRRYVTSDSEWNRIKRVAEKTVDLWYDVHEGIYRHYVLGDRQGPPKQAAA